MLCHEISFCTCVPTNCYHKVVRSSFARAYHLQLRHNIFSSAVRSLKTNCWDSGGNLKHPNFHYGFAVFPCLNSLLCAMEHPCGTSHGVLCCHSQPNNIRSTGNDQVFPYMFQNFISNKNRKSETDFQAVQMIVLTPTVLLLIPSSSWNLLIFLDRICSHHWCPIKGRPQAECQQSWNSAKRISREDAHIRSWC